YDASIELLPTTPGGMRLSNWNLVIPVDPPKTASTFHRDIVLDAGQTILGRLVAADGKSLSDVQVVGETLHNNWWMPHLNANFELRAYDGKGPRQLLFQASGGTLVGRYRAEGPAPKEIVVQLEPAVRVKGRLLEGESGVAIYCEQSTVGNSHVEVTTEDDGRFEIKGLMTGAVYKIHITNRPRSLSMKKNFNIDLRHAKPGDLVDLGDIGGEQSDTDVRKPQVRHKDASPEYRRTASPPSGLPTGIRQMSRVASPGHGSTLTIRKAPSAPDVPIQGRIVDLEGRPVPGISVKIISIVDEGKAGIDTWLADLKSGATHGRYPLSTRLIHSVSGPPTVTDNDGRFVVNGIGGERFVSLELKGESIVFKQITVVTRPMQPITRLVSDYISEGEQIFGADFTYIAAPSRPIQGTVRDAATGEALSGVSVQSWRFADSEIEGRRDLRVETDQKGQFRLVGMPKGKDNKLFLVPNDDQPYFMRGVAVPDGWGNEPAKLDVELHRGLWITGRVTDKTTGKPVADARVHYLPFLDNPFTRKLPEFHRGSMDGDEMRYTTRADGSFRLVGLPGRAIVGAAATQGFYLRGVGASEIAGMDQRGHFATYLNPIWPGASWPNVLKEINPRGDEKSIHCDLALDPGQTLRVTVVDRAGKPVEGAAVFGWSAGGFETQQKSSFDMINLFPGEKRPVLIRHDGLKLGKFLTVEFSDKTPRSLTVALEPCATIVGRLVDRDGVALRGQLEGVPRPGGDFWPRLPARPTHVDGTFEYELPPGCAYWVAANGQKFRGETVAKAITVEAGKTLNLGDIKIKRRG
ncbi:MAG TPA: hypothetical protein VGP63_20960, partial [Planctomycetaceae bacterium]|nr:hypothetical protein [Planctomycetaceae bacterium]